MALAAFAEHQLAFLDPHHMAHVDVGGGGKAHLLARRHLYLDHFQGMIGGAENLAPDIACFGISPLRLSARRKSRPVSSARSSNPARVRSKAVASRTRMP